MQIMEEKMVTSEKGQEIKFGDEIEHFHSITYDLISISWNTLAFDFHSFSYINDYFRYLQIAMK